MDRPDLETLSAKFGLLLGRWEGQETSSAGLASGRHSVRLALNGTAAVQDYVQLRQGQPALAGHGVYTLDPASGEVLWYFFDSAGVPPVEPARGRWHGDVLRLLGRTPRGRIRSTLSFGANAFGYVVERRLEDVAQFSTFLTARYRRVG